MIGTCRILCLCCWFVLAYSSRAGGDEAAGERPELRAARLSVVPSLDGDVLDDPAWQGLDVATSFHQAAPDEGKPASESTEVRIGFTDEHLWIAVVCRDRDPESIHVAGRRRDASLDDEDSFQVILDTYLDHQGGFVFGTNPAGVEYDAQVTEEGNDDGINREWNTKWEVRSLISELGWSAEMAIPFRSLRYGRDAEQRWGLNFQRNIRRRNETAYWARMPRNFSLHRLSMAGTLEGLEVPPQRNLKLIPYALGSATAASDGASSEDGEAGFDLKYSVTPSLTLDATYNTDFAQVEADEIQINLDRFRLFFPEKRPFFLENAGQFAVGVPQEIELFFSRRIGIGGAGVEIPIDGGLRLSGKVGRSTNVGLLWMQTDQAHGVAPSNEYGVIRLNRELPNRSSLGALMVERRGDGDDRNRTYAVDGRWGIGRYGYLAGFAAKTETPGVELEDSAFRIGGGYDSPNWSSGANYTDVGAGFNPEVGFLARSDYSKIDAFALRRIRPENLWGLLELRPHISYRGFWKPDGFQETGYIHLDNHWEFVSGFEFHTGVNFTKEGVRRPFEIVDGVEVGAGTYDHAEAALVFLTNPGASLSFEARLVAGGFFGGDRISFAPELRYRFGETFSSEIEWSHNSIDLPAGSFETNLARLRLTYSFTSKISLQALLQYNDRDDAFATNVRFAWLQTGNAGLYVVYNEVREDLPGMTETNRELIIKVSRILDLLR